MTIGDWFCGGQNPPPIWVWFWGGHIDILAAPSLAASCADDRSRSKKHRG